MELEERYHIDIEELKINLLSESERILVFYLIYYLSKNKWMNRFNTMNHKFNRKINKYNN